MSEKVIIEEIVPISEDKESPVLLNFQNGKLNVEATDSLKYTTGINNETKEKQALLAVNGNIYHGPIKKRHPSDLVDTFIAVRNKKTNKVRLIQVQQASMINSIYDPKDREQNNQLVADSEKALLIKKFGGRRAIRNFERTERMKVNLDGVKDQLENTVDNTNDLDKEETNQESLTTIIPPFNKSAKKVEDVFSLYDIVPKELMDRLNQEAEAVLGTKMEDLPVSSVYVKQRIKDIKNSATPSSNENLNVTKALIYLDALGNLIKSRQRNLSKITISNITEKVENDIRERFSQPDVSSKLNTSYTKNKAISYYLALALLTSPKYEASITVLTQDLSMPRQKLVKFAHYVNAKPKSRTDQLHLELPETMKPLKSFRNRKRL